MWILFEAMRGLRQPLAGPDSCFAAGSLPPTERRVNHCEGMLLSAWKDESRSKVNGADL